MPLDVDNRPDPDYRRKLAKVAETARDWDGPITIVSHVDPDGDALGSCLALRRALVALDHGNAEPRSVTIALTPPSYLEFLAEPGELVPELAQLAPNTLLFILDVADRPRAAGAPLDGAAFTINIDHHGTNDRFGDIAIVQPDKAATAMLIKELIDELGVEWSAAIATPCLAGIITDTGNFRFANTDRAVLETAGELIDHGVAYVQLTDRLQWRHPAYFPTLGKVMSTVHYELEGRLVIAHFTAAVREAAQAADDDSDDFVGIIRYAEGVQVAALLKERNDGVKISVRTRNGVSAQNICVELGGGGHVAAAGATVAGSLAEVEAQLVAATARELKRVEEARLSA